MITESLSAWEIGLARADITAWEPNMAMMGWGLFQHRVRGVASPLHARVCVIRNAADGTSVAFACLDLCFVPLLLREAILDKLCNQWPERGFHRHNVMLVATHTHCAPAGLSDSPLYNAVNFGFSPQVFDHIVQNTVQAILQADDRRRPGRIRPGQVEIPTSELVAFNRSLTAFNANEEVESASDRAMATDREMFVLRLEDSDGEELGAICWFSTHSTCIHSDHFYIDPDHKGLAASLLEAERRGRDRFPDEYVAIFPQGAAGDVTPNFRYCSSRGFNIGAEDDDEASAMRVARIQAHFAVQALEIARAAQPLAGPLSGYTRHVSLGEIAIAPEFAQGHEGVTTCPAKVGLSFMMGTLEGPGPVARFRGPVLAGMRRRRRVSLKGQRRKVESQFTANDPMIPVVELSKGIEGRFFGVLKGRQLGFLAPFDATIAWLNGARKSGVFRGRPWVPPILPAQLLRLGTLVIAGVGGEPTTVTGRRLRNTLLEALAPRGVERVIITGYANAYAGYVTTYEEYLFQNYEGSSTLFGPWTEAGWRTVLRDMAWEDWPQSPIVPGPLPVLTSREILLQEREEGRKNMGRFQHFIADQSLESLHR